MGPIEDGHNYRRHSDQSVLRFDPFLRSIKKAQHRAARGGGGGGGPLPQLRLIPRLPVENILGPCLVKSVGCVRGRWRKVDDERRQQHEVKVRKLMEDEEREIGGIWSFFQDLTMAMQKGEVTYKDLYRDTRNMEREIHHRFNLLRKEIQRRYETSLQEKKGLEEYSAAPGPSVNQGLLVQAVANASQKYGGTRWEDDTVYTEEENGDEEEEEEEGYGSSSSLSAVLRRKRKQAGEETQRLSDQNSAPTGAKKRARKVEEEEERRKKEELGDAPPNSPSLTSSPPASVVVEVEEEEAKDKKKTVVQPAAAAAAATTTAAAAATAPPPTAPAPTTISKITSITTAPTTPSTTASTTTAIAVPPTTPSTATTAVPPATPPTSHTTSLPPHTTATTTASPLPPTPTTPASLPFLSINKTSSTTDIDPTTTSAAAIREEGE